MKLERLRALARRTCAAALLLYTTTALPQPIWTAYTLPADGVVAGPAGSTVGWGYHIENDDLDHWLVLTGVSADPFQHGTPLALFDLPVLSPGSVREAPFGGPFALYGLNWDIDAPAGFTNVGNFLLTGEWWSGDPFAGGQFVADAETLVLAYAATVTAQQGEVPLPSSLALLAAGGGAWLLARRRRPAGGLQHLFHRPNIT